MQPAFSYSPGQRWCWEKEVYETLSFPLMLLKIQDKPL